MLGVSRRRTVAVLTAWSVLALSSCGHASPHETTRDRAKAPAPEALDEAACEAGNADACVATAERLAAGLDRADPARSASVQVKIGGLFIRACELASARACYAVAIGFQANGGAEAHATAHAFYEKACTLGEGAACTSIGSSLMLGAGPAHEANTFLERGCALGDGGGCTLLGGSYAAGLGVPENLPRARELEGKGCELGDALGCMSLGVAYRKGSGVRQDGSRANALFERACDFRYGHGCRERGLNEVREGTAESWSRANAWFQKACDLGEARSCNELGSNLLGGRGGPPDPQRGSALRRRACELGLQEACAPP